MIAQERLGKFIKYSSLSRGTVDDLKVIYDLRVRVNVILYCDSLLFTATVQTNLKTVHRRREMTTTVNSNEGEQSSTVHDPMIRESNVAEVLPAPGEAKARLHLQL